MHTDTFCFESPTARKSLHMSFALPEEYLLPGLNELAWCYDETATAKFAPFNYHELTVAEPSTGLVVGFR